MKDAFSVEEVSADIAHSLGQADDRSRSPGVADRDARSEGKCRSMTNRARTTRLVAIYEILSRTYPTYEEMDDPWMANGLSATPFRHLVSAACRP